MNCFQKQVIRDKRFNFVIALLVLFFSLGNLTLGAQILSPDFLCVTNNVLTWTPAGNSCGAFNAYEIYGSTNEQGPYSLLINETDPNQTSYFHEAANNQTWYYYLATNANCPGEMTLFSDTLDNLIPIVSPIQNVLITPTGVEINWNPSPSPEVIAYVVSRNTASGTVELATITGGLTTFLDTTADPENEVETYFVVAIDACDNRSLVTNPHNTILLEVSPPDICQAGVVLNWNPYENWQAGVSHYDILLSVNNGIETNVGQVATNSTNFTFMGANDGENLCFRVIAVEDVSLLESHSSTACTDINILQPIRDVELLGASVNPDGSVEIEWYWDETALISTANLLTYRIVDDVVEVMPLSLTVPLNSLNAQTVLGINAQTGPYVFNLDAADECQNQVTSNASQTPFLKGMTQGETSNLLTWDSYEHELATMINYELVKISAIGENVVFSGTVFDTKYTDELNIGGTNDTEHCYYLRVLVDYTLANGEQLSRVLHSNTVCLIPEPEIYVPNVFASNSVNNKFRPYLSFSAATEYNMDIFDRWGAHLFNSKDVQNGWNGQRNGQLMPQGVYLYSIEIKPESGELIRLTGGVLLLH